MPVVVDASVWIEFFAGRATPQSSWLGSALGKQSLAVGDLIVGEVLRGFPAEKEQETARKALAHFLCYTIGGMDLVVESARYQRLLHEKGEPVPDQLRCLIAAFCIHWKMPLLHSDPAYEPFERHLGLAGSSGLTPD
ncbi:MAG TPA: VapC toxin family PIN domain ribonuclease [Thermoanaerobaculia bacterium]|nr:VapC toxin family PIN domain ribonuclease [Thermoanaerobaculia bacterium]